MSPATAELSPAESKQRTRVTKDFTSPEAQSATFYTGSRQYGISLRPGDCRTDDVVNGETGEKITYVFRTGSIAYGDKRYHNWDIGYNAETNTILARDPSGVHKIVTKPITEYTATI